MLAEVTRLAAELEANAAVTSIVSAPAAPITASCRSASGLWGKHPCRFETLGSFLEKRLAPAMRTCQSVEERQANLSRKLARATSLIRSWIDVELERQNSDLLTTMNKRAEMQLRLQQTVEGLSVRPSPITSSGFSAIS